MSTFNQLRIANIVFYTFETICFLTLCYLLPMVIIPLLMTGIEDKVMICKANLILPKNDTIAEFSRKFYYKSEYTHVICDGKLNKYFIINESERFYALLTNKPLRCVRYKYDLIKAIGWKTYSYKCTFNEKT